jgi:GNAT superfamily N-acetyltransferase
MSDESGQYTSGTECPDDFALETGSGAASRDSALQYVSFDICESGGSVEVQEATQQDRQDIERIWRNQFDDPNEECHQQTLDECLDSDHDLFPYSQAYVATDARGRVVGFGLVALRNTSELADNTTLDESEFSGRDGYLYLGAVADDWQGKGIGTQLFAQRLRWCVDQDANAIYGVAWQNPEGRTSDFLFDEFNFEEVAETPDDYYRGRDCVVCGRECDCTGVIYRRVVP